MLVLPNNGGEGGSVDIIDGLESSDRSKALSANQGKVLNEKIESLKQSVGSGKNVLAKAVTDMGIPTLADYSFEDIARNISLINKATFLDTEFTQSATVDNTVSARMGVKSIKGKTLVNLWDDTPNFKIVKDNTNHNLKVRNVKPGTKYTLILFCDKNVEGVINLKDANNGYSNLSAIGDVQNINTPIVFTTLGSGDFSNVYFRLYSRLSDVNVNGAILLEGDHTQNPPNPFEGMLSVGQDNDNKIEVLSCNQNLCEIPSLPPFIVSNSISIGTVLLDKIVAYNIPITQRNIKFFYNISHNTELKAFLTTDIVDTSIASHNSMYGYVKNNNLGKEISINNGSIINIDTQYKYITITTGGSVSDSYVKLGDTFYIKNIMCCNSNSIGTEYVPYQSNKKEILLSEPHRGINDSICDEIAYLDETDVNASQGEGLYHIKRCSERAYQAGDENNSNVVTDMTNTVYQLDSPIVTKIDDIELYSHDEQTNIFVNGGAIPVTSTIGVGVNISATLNSLNNQVKSLSEDTVKYAITQNRLTLTTRYQADNANFKVDYTGIKSPNIESTDTDLYKLLEDNITIGKENYNYQEILEIIDFYAINGLITWDMWDVLWLMIDKQQNPENYQDEIVEVPNEAPEI